MLYDALLWPFLAGTVAIYWMLPEGWRLPGLALASLALIAVMSPVSAVVLLALATLTWLAAPHIARGNRPALVLMIGAIVAAAGPLIVFKWTSTYGLPLLDGSLLRFAVPLGMSYYSFRLIHVLVDAFRLGAAPQSARDFFAYAFLFTIFVAGPIERYDHFVANRAPAFRHEDMRDGLMRIAIGLVKQGVFVELIVWARGRAFSELPYGLELLQEPALQAWLLLLLGYIIAYLNLGAYSDLAIGASRLFGLRIAENFNFPILARNLSDFWRRWHMSLSSWCQIYVFSPVLGTTRLPYLALVASFLVMGLWHTLTLNRIGWGLFHAGGLVVLYALSKTPAMRRSRRSGALRFALAWAITQLFVTLSFLFVHEEASNDLLLTLAILVKLVTFGLLQ